MKNIRKMSALFPELVTDILLRLPVRSLLRFRCLSTSLCAEIDSENFVNNHLNRSIQRKTRQKLIVRNLGFEGGSDFYFADFDDDIIDAFPLNNPWKSRHRCTSVYGSCNGLILLGMDSEVKRQSLDFALWNPFTRRYKILPPCPVRTLPAYRLCRCSALGYDSAHDDYKIVKISMVADSHEVWVFSLKSDFWRRSLDLGDEVTPMTSHFANGAVYSLCPFTNTCFGFDLAKEVLFDIPQLSDGQLSKVSPLPAHLVVFGGNVYLATKYNKTVEYYLLVSDVSDKGGEVVGFSWRKEFPIENVGAYKFKFGYRVYAPPLLAYSKDADSILLEETNGIFWHNLENKTKKRVNIAGLPEVPSYDHYVCWGTGFEHCVCWESLVSVGKNSAFDGAAEEVMIIE